MALKGTATRGLRVGQGVTNSIDRMIAKQIKRRRLAAGITEAECAAKLGVSMQQFEHYERGTKRVPASHLMLLARLLGVSVGVFFEKSLARIDAADSGKVVALAPALRQKPSPNLEERLLRSFRAIKYRRDKQLVADIAARLAETYDTGLGG